MLVVKYILVDMKKWENIGTIITKHKIICFGDNNLWKGSCYELMTVTYMWPYDNSSPKVLEII